MSTSNHTDTDVAPQQENVAPSVDPALQIPSGKFLGIAMSQETRMIVGAIGMVVSAFFHLLPILYLVGFGTLVGYLAGQIYAVGTMCIWIFITTGKDYIIEMFKNIKNIICGIIALALQILILLFMGIRIIAIVLEVALVIVLFYLYYSICPLIVSCIDTKFGVLKSKKKSNPQVQK